MSSDIEILEGRSARVGELSVRRALPTRGRRTVGAWCFLDHMGPQSLSPDISVDVAPHPHIGLQTVTWMFSGEFLHRDSLGSEQLIRPGQLNLMSAGRGVVHSEENPGPTSGDLHGMQLWIAQPSSTRDDAPAFEHHRDLPKFELANVEATVLVGEMGTAVSPARRDSDLMGAELRLYEGVSVLPLLARFEYALVVAHGRVRVGTAIVQPGQLAFLGSGRDEIALSTDSGAAAMIIGGVPFDERVFMWWNFVARSRDEVSEAWKAWASGDERFGRVASPLARIDAAAPVWMDRPR